MKIHIDIKLTARAIGPLKIPPIKYTDRQVITKVINVQTIGFRPSIWDILNIAIGVARTPARPMTPKFPASAGRLDRYSFIVFGLTLEAWQPDTGAILR